jgi:hypothetical protein
MTTTKQDDNDPSMFDILPGDMIVGLTDTSVSHFIKSEPYRTYSGSPWVVDTIEMTTTTDPKTNEQTTTHTDTIFPLMALARFKERVHVTDADGASRKKFRKYRNFKLVRMPRENERSGTKE